MAEKINPEAKLVFGAIQSRRTLPYTKMSDEPIAQEHLDLVLDAANWAPSHKHTEPWRFVIFRGEGRTQLSNLLSRTYKATAGDQFLPRKYRKAQQRPLQVPLILAILMRPSQRPLMPEFEELLAVGCAMQNLHLVAHSLGIGCSWSTPKYLEHPNIRSFFNLGERDRCLGFYYMGYAKDDWPKSQRKPISDKIIYLED